MTATPRKSPHHAAITIISKNYFAYAKTLAASYKNAHPDHDFIVILADELDGYATPDDLAPHAELLLARDLQLPSFSTFPLRYSILEVNTAIKPFALDYLFRTRRYDTLLYLDPDIYVYQPLHEVYAAFERASVILTPHMRRPFHDSNHPADVHILQSGTYNLGFLGLRYTTETADLLWWWMSKLYVDCVVDIPNGLFVDQKWMDLAPAFVPDHHILHHPGYNAAYWNLHERFIQHDGSNYSVDGGYPLIFFHFSGYSPFRPEKLSKHQSRHALDDQPALRKLFSAYSASLFSNGHDESHAWPYAYQELPNGVRLPVHLTRDVVQHLLRSGINFPDPYGSPDDFCAFLARPNSLPQVRISPIVHSLLERRPDVAGACPGARRDSHDPAFLTWLRNTGAVEEDLTLLLPWLDPSSSISAPGLEKRHDLVTDAFSTLRTRNRTDVFREYSGMWRSPATFDAFAQWFTEYGANEEGFTSEHTTALRRAYPNIARIFHVYFLRGDLQRAFNQLENDDVANDFCDWLTENRADLGLRSDDCALFREYITSEPTLFGRSRFLYTHYGRPYRPPPSIYEVDERRYAIQSALTTQEFVDWLAEEPRIPPIEHYHARNRRVPSPRFDDAVDGLELAGIAPRRSHAFVQKIHSDLRKLEQPSSCSSSLDRRRLNFAGFLGAATGMGQSARTNLELMRRSGLDAHAFELPSPAVQGSPPANPVAFGWPVHHPDLSMAVANADSVELLRVLLPCHFWAPKNVAYWVWETETLPPKFQAAASLFDEVWTPSAYSARAIMRTVDAPVRVLPHAVDFSYVDSVTPNRRDFGLPEESTLYGFFFDPSSVFERKNVLGLLSAFHRAYSASDNMCLVLKINTLKEPTGFEFQRLMAIAQDTPNVCIVKGAFSRSDSLSLLKSLDVYVSLHRAEGFGLTIAEAMASHVPVIASAYSGNMDFMDEGSALAVSTDVYETTRAHGPYPAGSRWGNPDLDEAAQHIRALLDSEHRADLATRGRKQVERTLSFERCTATAADLLTDLDPCADPQIPMPI